MPRGTVRRNACARKGSGTWRVACAIYRSGCAITFVRDRFRNSRAPRSNRRHLTTTRALEYKSNTTIAYKMRLTKSAPRFFTSYSPLPCNSPRPHARRTSPFTSTPSSRSTSRSSRPPWPCTTNAIRARPRPSVRWFKSSRVSVTAQVPTRAGRRAVSLTANPSAIPITISLVTLT